ncbi:TlyA family rRNA (cytidine-2'-O)-methyltransferase [Pontibacillus yanchengensis]|uniref:TlyA family rRNA (Cytidine-2'-O)-methyltransferase n=2 Tax=Pontibacillus yanchengensis TaxID=462910 RepID=A0ACC7VG56_9BACI|nr:TlyA family RNA methyltransferase [Pontibacillus yanchengensis]MYL33530.1 TlyA family rRNA (cytidine-2'-O)-methyltransferase [Pontibacillus yanchengensis]MYL53580.1 TlyA family rRNA (cytidine-2'-O)-methyltransferase [Pontibacillus yanchengensis]
MPKKVRLDTLLVERGLVETREKAKRTIMAGLVFSENMKMDKPGVKVDEELPLHVKGKAIPYVSRGGLKLEKAIHTFQLNVKDKILIDIGSSTGGFTDCALQNGAKKSYAIDVGYNQLDWKLRNDERVIVMERTNFRYVTAEDLKEGAPNLASIDVSFISLKLILPVLATLLEKDGDVVTLIKPQFEAGREQVGKKGIIRDAKVHKQVLQDILQFAVSKGYVVENITYSPITGGDGNIEFLAHLRMSTTGEGMFQPNVEVERVVQEAHNAH